MEPSADSNGIAMNTRVAALFFLLGSLSAPVFCQASGQLQPNSTAPNGTVLGTVETFEAFPIAPGTAANINCPVLNATAICSSEGPGLVVSGVNFVFDGWGAQWDGAGYYGAPSREFVAIRKPLTVDFTTPVTVFGIQLRALARYGATASMTVYGLDDSTVIGTLSGIELSTRGVPRLVAWQDQGGIGKVVLSQFDQPSSPVIDNLNFADPPANLAINPNRGFPGVPIDITGSGFAPNETIKLIYQPSNTPFVLGTLTADASGAVAGSARVPPVVNGTYVLYAAGQTSGLFGAALLSVEPVLVPEPNAGAPGSNAQVQGAGFLRGEAINVYWDSPRVLLGTATADENGRFPLFSFTVPESAAPGDNLVVGQGEESRALGAGHFTVQ